MERPPQNHEAIERLQKAGLTEYEAKCFVALSQLTTGTAEDVSDISDIPRTRVYDLAEGLQEKGLVDVRDGTPREFRAVSTDIAVQNLQRRYNQNLDAATEALRAVSTPDRNDTASELWRVEGQQNVIHRGQYVAAQAETELFGIFTEDAVFQNNCFHQAQDAIDRGVDVVLGTSDEGLYAELQEGLPEATIWSPSLDWQTLDTEGTQLSRLVMADRDLVMLASIREGTDGYEETAVWGEGIESELVILCRQLIGSQLDELREYDDAPVNTF